jgi:hypothetical protein
MFLVLNPDRFYTIEKIQNHNYLPDENTVCRCIYCTVTVRKPFWERASSLYTVQYTSRKLTVVLLRLLDGISKMKTSR